MLNENNFWRWYYNVSSCIYSSYKAVTEKSCLFIDYSHSTIVLKDNTLCSPGMHYFLYMCFGMRQLIMRKIFFVFFKKTTTPNWKEIKPRSFAVFQRKHQNFQRFSAYKGTYNSMYISIHTHCIDVCRYIYIVYTCIICMFILKNKKCCFQ